MGNRVNQFLTAGSSVRPDSCTFPKMGRIVTLMSDSYFTYFGVIVWVGTNKDFFI